jgi:hypothetical protein
MVSGELKLLIALFPKVYLGVFGQAWYHRIFDKDGTLLNKQHNGGSEIFTNSKNLVWATAGLSLAYRIKS